MKPDELVTPAHLSRAQRWSIGTPVTVTLYTGAIVDQVERFGGDGLIDCVTLTAPWRHKGRWVIRIAGLPSAFPLARVQARR